MGGKFFYNKNIYNIVLILHTFGMFFMQCRLFFIYQQHLCLIMIGTHMQHPALTPLQQVRGFHPVHPTRPYSYITHG